MALSEDPNGKAANYNYDANGEHIPVPSPIREKPAHRETWYMRAVHSAEHAFGHDGGSKNKELTEEEKEIAKKHKSVHLKDIFMMGDGRSMLPPNWFVPARYVVDSKHRHIHVRS